MPNTEKPLGSRKNFSIHTGHTYIIVFLRVQVVCVCIHTFYMPTLNGVNKLNPNFFATSDLPCHGGAV